jgi:hypothetical protein
MRNWRTCKAILGTKRSDLAVVRLINCDESISFSMTCSPTAAKKRIKG